MEVMFSFHVAAPRCDEALLLRIGDDQLFGKMGGQSSGDA
jgi:hypothetical protein